MRAGCRNFAFCGGRRCLWDGKVWDVLCEVLGYLTVQLPGAPTLRKGRGEPCPLPCTLVTAHPLHRGMALAPSDIDQFLKILEPSLKHHSCFLKLQPHFKGWPSTVKMEKCALGLSTRRSAVVLAGAVESGCGVKGGFLRIGEV